MSHRFDSDGLDQPQPSGSRSESRNSVSGSPIQLQPIGSRIESRPSVPRVFGQCPPSQRSVTNDSLQFDASQSRSRSSLRRLDPDGPVQPQPSGSRPILPPPSQSLPARGRRHQPRERVQIQVANVNVNAPVREEIVYDENFPYLNEFNVSLYNTYRKLNILIPLEPHEEPARYAVSERIEGNRIFKEVHLGQNVFVQQQTYEMMKRCSRVGLYRRDLARAIWGDGKEFANQCLTPDGITTIYPELGPDTEFNNDQPDDQANDQAYDQPDDQPDDQRMLEEFSSSDSEMQIDQNMEEEDNVSTNADDDNLHEHFWCDDLLYTSTDTLFDFEKIDNFEDLLKCRELHEKINVPTDISRGELLLMLLKFSIRNELSMSAMTNLFQLVNTIYKRPVLFNSRHMLDKFFNVKDQLQYQIICYECSSDLGTDRLEKITCSICNAENDKNNQEKSAYFVLLNPAEQIRDLLMQNLEYFTYVTQQRPHEFSHLSDVYDGIKYHELLSSLTPEEKKNYVTAVFNTDGASKFKCSQQSAWPLYLMINELPKHIRTKHLVICGIFFGPKKPDVLIFIDKFIDLIKNVTIPCTINNEERLIKMYILTCCVDAVARVPIQGIKQFNGNYGCNWCLHPGVTHGVKKFPILSETPRLREHNEMVELMMEADPDNPKLGVMYPSPLLNLPKFDLVDGFIPDYLHMALEGVAKQFANYHLDKLDDTLSFSDKFAVENLAQDL
uniref:Uncharacterized protein n=1 Tax=Trichogramma kaykai TaxID=54128 RepID=A0ABD2WHN0_9HYME